MAYIVMRPVKQELYHDTHLILCVLIRSPNTE